jgi:class 3 adenylate cyclase
MCAPFVCKNELLGIISVDTISHSHAFNVEDLAMLTSIAGQAAIAIKNADLYITVEKETQTRTLLSRYLSPDVVEGVIQGTIPLTLGGERKNGTVLFCDIVGFTPLSEKLEALEVVALLNRYFCSTTEIISRNRGTLHKFGGDMIMAFWNVMFADQSAQYHALCAGVELQKAVWDFDCELQTTGQPLIHVGIGCNTGEFAGGNIGGTDRMEYTVIGDNVNLAQRIESRASRWQVLASEQTWEPAQESCIAIKLPPAQVKGKSQPVQIYSIRGILGTVRELILTIPVDLTFGEETEPLGGFICGFRIEQQELILSLPGHCCHESGSRFRCELVIPELSRRMVLSGRVKTNEHTKTMPVFSQTIVLGELSGDDALEFLKPGALFTSKKSWEEMARH